MSNILDPSRPQPSPKVEKFINEVVRKYSPKFVIRDKTHKTGLYAVASFFAKIFNDKIDTRFLTQVLHECWVPPGFLEAPDEHVLMAIAHETLHEHDRRKMSVPVAFLLYFFPQVLAVFSMLAILAIWFGPGWLICLGFLLFLLPLPAPGRMWLELRAYRVNMLFLKYVYQTSAEGLRATAENFATHYTGPNYYFMWPFKNHITNLLLKEVKLDIYEEYKLWLVREGFIDPSILEREKRK
jgi:hypothetical protein